MELILFFLIILLASVLQTSSGFGFSIMATPFLLMLFSPQEAMQINIVLSLVISLSLIWTIRHDVDFSLIKRIFIGSIFGAPLGSVLFATVDLVTFKLIVGVILIGVTLLLMKNFSIQPTRNRDYAVGFLSGLLTTSIGMAGPPLLLYFAGTQKNKENMRATSIVFYIFIYLISLMSQLVIEGTNKTVWVNSLYALPIVMVGLFFGQLLFKKINQQLFRRMIYILLLVAGVFLLSQSILTM
ncbi:membrane protein [Lysinibacillus contaminans]|uniref:Probable membrane transporter protein n=1 Tax=Lysinibacillus contaminans TaxID=1293441 RepID=A0ABR5K514_9BACI|nr:sulfite exporter TauE/SafE family protein [Lysinibacillus contaminans]KOS69848.1 membrane protein [Lysinibacillus contaminans]